MSEHRKVTSEKGLAILEHLRSICARLPEVGEHVDSFGHSSFRVNDKPFVMVGENEEGPSLAVKTDKFTQELLLQQGGYYKTPYIGQHGWVSLRGEQPIEWKEIEQLISETYRRIAPKRLVRLLT